jgi:hypothetical protein
MRDLLYLSENKMRALIPQIPGGIRRRLQVEAGLNIGVASAKAALTGDPQRPSVGLRLWKWCSGLDLIRGFVPASGLVPA